MNKNDLRYLKTEKNIINSFLECVDDLGFEKTRISDICHKAMISRNTFYAHYEDKYALLNDIISQLEKEMMEKVLKAELSEAVRATIENKETGERMTDPMTHTPRIDITYFI